MPWAGSTTSKAISPCFQFKLLVVEASSLTSVESRRLMFVDILMFVRIFSTTTVEQKWIEHLAAGFYRHVVWASMYITSPVGRTTVTIFGSDDSEVMTNRAATKDKKGQTMHRMSKTTQQPLSR